MKDGEMESEREREGEKNERWRDWERGGEKEGKMDREGEGEIKER